MTSGSRRCSSLCTSARDDPAAHAGQDFVDCFVTYEERTRTVTTVDEDGNEVETQETYTVAVPISDLQIYQNIGQLTGTEVTPEQQPMWTASTTL